MLFRRLKMTTRVFICCFTLKFLCLVTIIECQIFNKEDTDKFLEDAGCKYGNLLDVGVCTMYGYRPHITPKVENMTDTIVHTTILHEFIRDVDDKKGILTIEFGLMLGWSDSKIRIPPDYPRNGSISLSVEVADKIWIPDFYVPATSDYNGLKESIQSISLEVQPGNPFHENTTFVKYRVEFKAKVYCTFFLSRYPLDVQNCKFRFGSKASDVNFIFFDPENRFHHSSKFEAVEFEVDLTFPTISLNDTDKNAPVGFDIRMQRIISPFIFKIYLPCIAIVVASSISFIVPLSAIPGRIALMVTQFLTLTNLFIYHMDESPSGTTLNLLGAYLFISLFFVLSTMIEFAIVLILEQAPEWKNAAKQKAMRRKVASKARNEMFRAKINNISYPNKNFEKMETKTCEDEQEMEMFSSCFNSTHKIDIVALFSFSILYLLFNCVYWIYV